MVLRSEFTRASAAASALGQDRTVLARRQIGPPGASEITRKRVNSSLDRSVVAAAEIGLATFATQISVHIAPDPCLDRKGSGNAEL
jgi:hypothetical protein